MTLEQQVCSLDLAKRLRELGVKQESLFVWLIKRIPQVQLRETIIATSLSMYAAFTVTELGEMLPDAVFTDGKQFYMDYLKAVVGGWAIKYSSESGEAVYMTAADTEADARAKMLIYLLENKLV